MKESHKVNSEPLFGYFRHLAINVLYRQPVITWVDRLLFNDGRRPGKARISFGNHFQ